MSPRTQRRGPLVRRYTGCAMDYPDKPGNDNRGKTVWTDITPPCPSPYQGEGQGGGGKAVGVAMYGGTMVLKSAALVRDDGLFVPEIQFSRTTRARTCLIPPARPEPAEYVSPVGLEVITIDAAGIA